MWAGGGQGKRAGSTWRERGEEEKGRGSMSFFSALISGLPISFRATARAMSARLVPVAAAFPAFYVDRLFNQSPNREMSSAQRRVP